MLTEEGPRKIGFVRFGASGYDYPSKRDVEVLDVLKFMEEQGA